MVQEILSLEGRTAVVTGGANGIGRAIAHTLSEAGAAVIIGDRDIGKARDLARSLGDSIPLEVDVSSISSVKALAEKSEEWRGKIDILVHSAGIGLEKSLLQTTWEEWDKIIQTNLTGAFFCYKAFGKQMTKNGYGRILGIASTAGLRGGSGRAAYGAAKGGLITLTKVAAVEFAELGVTVNALAPGAIETELVVKMHSEETRVNYRKSIPMNRYGQPNEVAAIAAFLVSERANYITGQIIGVDGGFLSAGIINRKYEQRF